jgi:thioredoxin reductase (NADPH)
MLITKATQLVCDRRPYVIEVASGIRISAHIVVIATGAQYRKLPLQNLSRFEGTGVNYGATFVEAQLCGREAEVIVVGGGNSADQAAVFLAQMTKRVHTLVRFSTVLEFVIFCALPRCITPHNIEVRCCVVYLTSIFVVL